MAAETHPLLADVAAFQQQADRRSRQPVSAGEARTAVRSQLLGAAPAEAGLLSRPPYLDFPGPTDRPRGEITAHAPSLSESLLNGIYGIGRSMGLTSVADRMRREAEYLPFVGDALMAARGTDQIGAGDYLSGAGNLGLAAIGAVPGVGDAAAAGARRVRNWAASDIARENYTGAVARHTPTLYRETSLEDAQYFLPHSGAATRLDRELHFADTPDLALGQGANRGVLMEFDSGDLQGRVNRAKPGWDHMWDQGMGEYILNRNHQPAYQQALRSITIKPDAQVSLPMRERMRRVLQWHEQRGWTRTTADDGTITLRRPE